MTKPATLQVVSTEIKIDKGVPMKIGRMGHHKSYPWDDMDVGDSFLLPSDLSPQSSYSVARDANLRGIGNGTNRKFKVSKTPEGYRCWRIA